MQHVKSTTTLITLIMLLGFQLSAQTISDALRYNQQNLLGSAALVGIGGAGGALGGDYSTTHINPAGLAEYKSSVFVFTPMLSNYSSDGRFIADFLSSGTDRKTGFAIANAGYVSSSQGKPGSSLTRFNFGIGFSRTADFNKDVFITGATAGSLIDRYVVDANFQGQGNLDPFSTDLADEAGALIFDAGANPGERYFSDLDNVDPEFPIGKTQTISNSGSMNELNLVFAGEVDRKLNFGFQLGIPIVNFEQQTIYTEADVIEGSPFRGINRTENLDISGAGINFKAGLQYKPIKAFRIGGAIHSPTFYSLTDNFFTTVDYSYIGETGNLITGQAISPDGNFRYRFTDAWRAVGSAATVFDLGNVKGFISADVEYADYSSSSFNLDAFSSDPNDALYANELNNQIGQELHGAMNYRIGTDLAIASLRLRGGLGWHESPFAEDAGTYDRSFSLGVGFRVNTFFLDLGFRRFDSDNTYNAFVHPSGIEFDPTINYTSTNNHLTITTGFQF